MLSLNHRVKNVCLHIAEIMHNNRDHTAKILNVLQDCFDDEVFAKYCDDIIASEKQYALAIKTIRSHLSKTWASNNARLLYIQEVLMEKRDEYTRKLLNERAQTITVVEDILTRTISNKNLHYKKLYLIVATEWLDNLTYKPDKNTVMAELVLFNYRTDGLIYPQTKRLMFAWLTSVIDKLKIMNSDKLLGNENVILLAYVRFVMNHKLFSLKFINSILELLNRLESLHPVLYRFYFLCAANSLAYATKSKVGFYTGSLQTRSMFSIS